MKLKFVLPVLMLAASCGSNATKNEETVADTTTLINDSLAIELSPEIKDLANRFQFHDAPQLIADSAFIEGIEKSDSLDSKHVKLLAAKWFDHPISNENSYDIESFYKIDSIKQAGKYAEYVRNLDIGMMKNSMVYAVAQFKISEKITLLIWALDYHSYEACPYSSGTSLYFTVLNEGVLGESFVLGEVMSAGDPPVGMTREIYGTLEHDGKFSLELKDINWDGNEEVITETKLEHYKFEILDGKVKLISEKKDKPKIKKQKVEE
jgi:hypothetical protein